VATLSHFGPHPELFRINDAGGLHRVDLPVWNGSHRGWLAGLCPVLPNLPLATRHTI
jgi:hypothetical protein